MTTTFKIATVKNAKDGQPKTKTYTIASLVAEISKPTRCSATFQAYHFQKSEEKRLNLAAREAKASGDLEAATKLKVLGSKFKDAVMATKTGLAYMPFIFKDDITFKTVEGDWKQRDNEQITHFSLIMLDVESQISAELLQATFKEFEFILWPTITHTPTDLRYRVVLFPETPLTIQEATDLIYRVDAYLPAHNDANKKTQAIDPASLDVGRLMYAPKWLTNHPEQYFYIHNTGAFLNKDSFPITATQATQIAARAAIKLQTKQQRQADTVKMLETNTTLQPALITKDDKLWLNPDGLLETGAGWIRVADIDRKISNVTCPVHTDSVGSEFVALNKNSGRPQLVCNKCGVFKMLPPPRPADDFTPATLSLKLNPSRVKIAHETITADVSAPARVIDARKLNTPIIEYADGALDPIILHLDQRYLSDPTNPEVVDVAAMIPERGVTIIKSPKGTGKTELLRTILQDQKKHKTMLIGHRVFLLRELAQRTGLANYQDMPNGVTSSFMAICLNSLTRLDPKTDIPYHTLVIDESEQVLQALLSKTVEYDIGEVFEKLVWVIKNATRIICLDADMTYDLTINLINIIRNRSEETAILGVVNDYKIGVRRTTKMYVNKWHLLFDCYNDIDAGERVFVATNHATFSTCIAAMFRQMGKRVLLVTAATTVTDEAQAFISNATVECEKYDVVVASPTLSTGISLDGNHFTKVYGFFNQRPGTFQDADQAISRVRNCHAAHIWIQGTSNDAKKTPLISEQYLYEQAITKEQKSVKNLIGHDHVLTPGQELWARIYACIKFNQNMWSRDKDEQFTTLRRDLGYVVDMVAPDKAIAEAMKAHYDNFKNSVEDRSEIVFSAEEIDEETAEELKNKKQLERHEYNSLERFRLQKLLKDKFNLENVRKAIQQHLQTSIKFLRHLRLDSTQARRERDIESRKKNRAAFTVNLHYTEQRELIDYLCTTASVDIESLHRRKSAQEMIEISKDQLAKIAAAFESRKRDFNFYFNARIKDATLERNYKSVWDTTFGKHFSLFLASDRKTVNGVKSQKYTINLGRDDLVSDVFVQQQDSHRS